MKKKQRGFTLIELLVVIAIIGILATIVMVSLNTARQKARDTRRISDARQVQLAEQLYYDSNPGTYGSIAQLVTAGYLSATPVDPSATTGSYVLTTANCSAAQGYVWKAILEATNPALNADLDTDTICTNIVCSDPAFNYCVGP